MRASLMMTVVTAAVVLILTVMGARACAPSSPTSPNSPFNVARNGLSGLCANQQATGAAGDGSPAPILDPGGLNALNHAAGGVLACPTTTTAAP